MKTTRRRAGRAGGHADDFIRKELDDIKGVFHRKLLIIQEHMREPRNYPGLYRSGLFDTLKSFHFYTVILAVLRSYRLTPAERKKLEAAAKIFDKTGLRISREARTGPKADQQLAADIEYYAGLIKLIDGLLESGTPCGDDQFCSASCFRIVDAGGFGRATLEHTVEIVDAAAKLLREHGFEKLCYGDIQIVKRVTREKAVLALYTIGDDQMHARPVGRGEEQAAVRTILHELGHRYEHKFMTGTQKAAMQALYRVYKRHYQYIEETEKPEPGTKYVDPGGTVWIIDRVEQRRIGQVGEYVVMHKEEQPSAIGSIHLAHYREAADPHGPGGVIRARRSKNFVTRYAMTDAGENFAEMFALFCMDALPQPQKHDFEEIVQKKV